MQLQTLHDLMIHELEDLLSAEKQILEALPKMQKAANSSELAEAFETHVAQTEEQVARLEEVAEILGIEFDEKTCQGMAGIIKEGSHILNVDGDPDVIDAALIGAAQKVEHYEMSGYGTVLEYAKLMNHDDVVAILKKTMGEEEETDKLLSRLAEKKINKQANRSN